MVSYRTCQSFLDMEKKTTKKIVVYLGQKKRNSTLQLLWFFHLALTQLVSWFIRTLSLLYTMSDSLSNQKNSVSVALHGHSRTHFVFFGFGLDWSRLQMTETVVYIINTPTHTGCHQCTQWKCIGRFGGHDREHFWEEWTLFPGNAWVTLHGECLSG